MGFQFAEKAEWIPSLGLSYYIGVDGLSLLMVLLTVAILPLCVLCSWTYIVALRIMYAIRTYYVLLILAFAGFGVLSLCIAGWASASKWGLIGAARAVAQSVGYEIPLLLAVLAVCFSQGSMDLLAT